MYVIILLRLQKKKIENKKKSPPSWGKWQFRIDARKTLTIADFVFPGQTESYLIPCILYYILSSLLLYYYPNRAMIIIIRIHPSLSFLLNLLFFFHSLPPRCGVVFNCVLFIFTPRDEFRDPFKYYYYLIIV